MTRTTGRVKNGSVGKTHIVQCFVNGLYDNRRRIKSCKDRITGGSVFFLRKQVMQLIRMCAAGSEVVRQTAPTDVLRKYSLFGRSWQTVFCLQLMECFDCVYIVLIPL